ncbi:MAG: hypothetical protein ACOZQL_36700 [Myxococcota bacterium]
MGAPNNPPLEAGRVYRTRDFAAWSSNPPRLAKRLVREGLLVPLAHGLFAHPQKSRFGNVPPTDQELMSAFLGDGRFVFTGSEKWNALGLGATAVFAVPLVYNTRRSGLFSFGGRSFQLRRVAFPERPPPEWFVIDLLENADQAGVSRAEVATALARALQRGAFDRARLEEMTKRFASKATASLVDAALRESRA